MFDQESLSREMEAVLASLGRLFDHTELSLVRVRLMGRYGLGFREAREQYSAAVKCFSPAYLDGADWYTGPELSEPVFRLNFLLELSCHCVRLLDASNLSPPGSTRDSSDDGLRQTSEPTVQWRGATGLLLQPTAASTASEE